MSLTKVAVIKRGPIEWDQDKLTPSELKNRITSLKALARSKDLAGVLVYGNALKSGNLCYFTNYSCHIAWRDGFLILPVEGDPLLLLEVPARDVPYIQRVTPVEVQACRNLGQNSLDLLKQKGMSVGNLGLAGWNDVPYTILSLLRQGLTAVKWIDITGEVSSWRRVKTEREQLLLQRSSCLATACMSDILEKAVPGISLRALEAGADYLARKQGCEDIQLLMAVDGNEPGPVSDYILKDGDSLRIILSTQILRYWSSMCRTVVVGNSKSAQETSILAAMEQEAALIKALSPVNFQKENLSMLAARVQGKIGLGGGIGLELEEGPDLAGDDFKPLPGMAVSLRVSMETGGCKVLHGDTILLTTGQPVVLTDIVPS